VGLMSIPALAVLYGGLIQKKWVVNTMLMVFTGFSLTLVVWVLWAYKMAFGPAAHLGGNDFFNNLVGAPGTLLSAAASQGQAVSDTNTVVPFHFSTATLAYFQFAFAAITPLLFLGGLIGRLKFKAWLVIVPLWITFVYAINAKLMWGGGFFALKGAVDFAGGFVIHLSAGVAAFVGAALIGPRIRRDRTTVPSNLMMVAIGAGILWLGWNGFNGGAPYYAGADTASAILNTNVATAVALLTWLIFDMLFSHQKKPTFLGAINGMICGLVGITPSAGFVNALGAIGVGFLCSAIVWVAWNYLSRLRPFRNVDDALGVVFTHGFAGLAGGLAVGLFADPKMAVYLADDGTSPAFSVGGWFYTHSFHQLWEQFIAAVWVIGYTAVGTTAVFLLAKLLVRGLRESDDVLEVGDLAIHDEEAFPTETFAERVSALSR
ncbi:MAG: ammonium transporter, partial [Acidobacteria bacterium]|nr:ammonium transporter [Acidobacteriota bacterium]